MQNNKLLFNIQFKANYLKNRINGIFILTLKMITKMLFANVFHSKCHAIHFPLFINQFKNF